METENPPPPEIYDKAYKMLHEYENRTQVKAAGIQADTKSPQKDETVTTYVLPRRYRIPKLSQGNRIYETPVGTESDESNKTFGQLKMTKLKIYEIPEFIREIEFDDNRSNLVSIEQMTEKAGTDESSYIALNTALIHLEEAANSRKVQMYDLKKIQLKLLSRIDEIFEIEYGEVGPNLFKAVRDGIVKEFAIKPLSLAMETNGLILGKVEKCNERSIYVKITEGINEVLPQQARKKQFYDLNFIINRTTFQLQHNALKWFKDHGLFTILIHNLLYSYNEERPFSMSDYKFRYKEMQNLQRGQKFANIY